LKTLPELSNTSGKKMRPPLNALPRLPLPPLPFVVVFRIRKDFVEIANVIHGAQKWPPKD